MTDNDRKCSCAKCMGIQPWASRFAQCIQQGWINADLAVWIGAATRIVWIGNIPVPIGDNQ